MYYTSLKWMYPITNHPVNIFKIHWPRYTSTLIWMLKSVILLFINYFMQLINSIQITSDLSYPISKISVYSPPTRAREPRYKKLILLKPRSIRVKSRPPPEFIQLTSIHSTFWHEFTTLKWSSRDVIRTLLSDWLLKNSRRNVCYLSKHCRTILITDDIAAVVKRPLLAQASPIDLQLPLYKKKKKRWKDIFICDTWKNLLHR